MKNLFGKEIKSISANKTKPAYTRIEYVLKDKTVIDIWVKDAEITVTPQGDGKRKMFLDLHQMDEIPSKIADGGAAEDVKRQVSLAETEIASIRQNLAKFLNHPKSEYRQALMNLIGKISAKDIEKELKKLIK